MPRIALLGLVFGLGIVLETWVGGAAVAWIAGAAAGVLVARRRAGAWVIVALLGGAGAAAHERAAAIVLGPPASGEVELDGVIVRAPQVGRGGAIVVIDARRADGRGPTWRVRVALRAGRLGAEALPGDRVRFVGRLGPVEAWRNPGTPDIGRARRGQGLDGVGTIEEPGLRIVERGGPSIARLAAEAQRALAQRLLGAPGGGARLVAAITAGTRAGLPVPVEEAFRRAGVSHVLSVSGLHLACVAAAAAALAGALWRRIPVLAARIKRVQVEALIALPVAGAYTLVTGAEVATVRALVMAIVLLGVRAMGRAADARGALAVAALVILAHRPSALFDPSLQLSLASSAALIAAARAWGAREQPLGAPTPGRAARLAGGLGRAILASLAVTAVTAPLTAFHFGVVQPAGVLLNLVVPPVLELGVLPLGLAAGVADLAWAGASDLLATLAAWLAAATIAATQAIAPWCPVLDVPPPHGWQLALLGGLAILTPRLGVRRAVFAALAVVVAIAGGELVAARRARAWTGARVTFLDVGQGDAALIEAPGGQVWLVDAGGVLFGDATPANDPGRRAVLPVLAARRIRAIDLVIVSHPHPDHVGGLVAVGRAVPIREVWITGDAPDEPKWVALLDELVARGTQITVPPVGVARTAGAARLEVLAPQGPQGRAIADPLVEVNDNSLVVRLSLAGRAVLFTGDLEVDGELALVERVPELAADVVKVPHHGSRTSSTEALVRATRARHAVVSLGARNRFGFPALEVIARWRGAGATVWRTDLVGAIEVVLGADGTLAVGPAVPP